MKKSKVKKLIRQAIGNELAGFDNRVRDLELASDLNYLKKEPKENLFLNTEHYPSGLLEVGKWKKYRSLRELCSLYYIISVDEEKEINPITSYGFDKIGNWSGTMQRSHSILGWTDASPEEVSTALINEAKRMYKVGDRVFDTYSQCHQTLDEVNRFDFQYGALFVLQNDNAKTCLFIERTGKWAEIVEQPLTELPERWAVKVTLENRDLISKWWASKGFSRGCMFTVGANYGISDGEGYSKHPDNDKIDYEVKIISTEDFKRLVPHAEPKENFDWGKQGNYAQGISGNAIFMITGTGSLNNTFSGVCLIGDNDTSKGDYSDNWDIVDFKPYTGEPITLN